MPIREKLFTEPLLAVDSVRCRDGWRVEILAADDCLLDPPQVERLIVVLRAWLDSLPPAGGAK